MILSVAMMFEYSLDNVEVSNIIKNSVENVLKAGVLTKDISLEKESVSTSQMGDALVEEIKKHV
jgi:isocitrate/isopropylmalate dehydrogenase